MFTFGQVPNDNRGAGDRRGEIFNSSNFRNNLTRSACGSRIDIVARAKILILILKGDKRTTAEPGTDEEQKLQLWCSHQSMQVQIQIQKRQMQIQIQRHIESLSRCKCYEKTKTIHVE